MNIYTFQNIPIVLHKSQRTRRNMAPKRSFSDYSSDIDEHVEQVSTGFKRLTLSAGRRYTGLLTPENEDVQTPELDTLSESAILLYQEKHPDSGYTSSQVRQSPELAPEPAPVCTEAEWRRMVDYSGDPPAVDVEDRYTSANVPFKVTAGDLKEDYHPLLSPQNFPLETSASGGVLSQLGPTFALATRFLTHEAVAKPWIHVMVGEETWDEELKLTYLQEAEAENDPEAYALFQTGLCKLKVKFIFAAITDKRNGQIHAFSPPARRAIRLVPPPRRHQL
jgi:hypothetical protein